MIIVAKKHEIEKVEGGYGKVDKAVSWVRVIWDRRKKEIEWTREWVSRE